MRRLDFAGHSQGVRGGVKGGARPGPAGRKPALRRLALEALESRELLSTLPTPIAIGQSLVGQSITPEGNSSSPSVSVDPINPNKLIAAWTTTDPNNKLDGTTGQVTTYVQAAFSVNGGQSWQRLTSGGLSGNDVNLQDDFSAAPSTTAPQPHFAQTTDATVAFGPDETAYLLTTSHTGASGVIDLQRWDFSGASPAPVAFARNAYDTSFESTFLNPIYRWQGGDQAVTPTLAVDTSTPDPTVAGSAQYAGNVYVAWQTIDSAPQNVTVYNPQAIKLVASSDRGQDFTYQEYLSGGTFGSHNSGNRFTSPRIAISAGGGGATPGQVTIVYDNAGPGQAPAIAPFFDIINTQTVTGSAVAQFENAGGNITNAAGAATSFPFQVNINDPKFTSLQNLTLSLSLSYPVLGDTKAVLTSPGGTSVTLWNNANDSAGAATNLLGTITGANMGSSAQHGTAPDDNFYIGTTLDSTAYRPLSGDTTVSAPFTGRFRPFQNPTGPFVNMTAAQLNGTWTLTITTSRAQTPATPPVPIALVGASLDFTSGLAASPIQNVATSFLNSGASSFTEGIQGVPVFANPTIAADNTRGANSPHKGRIYLTFTDDNFNTLTQAYTDSTFIRLYYSDNGGASWTSAGIVNDDDGTADGFSTGGFEQPGTSPNFNFDLAYASPRSNVRPKLQPQVAVDSYTGTVVVSFFDTRNDASKVRVSTYIAASDDGGLSFAPQTYANPSQIAKDAITGNTVNLGPIPDNQSAGNGHRETVFGFGQRQGLAVANGHIIPVWSSNLNGTSLGNLGSNLRNSDPTYLQVESAVLGYAAGPRVIGSTQGPVGEAGDIVNGNRTADGTPIANTIVFVFDRAVDPTTFFGDGASPIGTSPLQVFYNNPTGLAAPVPLRVLSVTPSVGNTVFTVKFDPAGHGVGTYSYTLRPLVRGLVPYPTTSGSVTGNLMDQNANGTPGQVGLDNYTVAAGPNQLPLIVPGPHVVATGVTGINGVVSTGTDNLVNNDSVKAIQVTFDRDIRTSSFTPDQVLNVLGPTGRVDGPQPFVATATARTFPYNGTAATVPQTPAGLVTVIPIAGTNLQVSRLTVQVNVTSPNNANLSLSLMAPDGTTIALVLANTATGANFTGTTFSDAVPANGLPPGTVALGQAPYGLTYLPAQALSGLSGKSLDGNWMLIIRDSTTGGTLARLNSWSLNITPRIPEGAGTLLDSTLVIPYPDDSFLVGKIAVQLDITAAQDSDLQVELISPGPNNVIVPLFSGVGGTGQNFSNTTLDQSATTPIASGVAPFQLIYRPAGDLTTLNNLSIRGTWTLRIIDLSANGKFATLNSWTLIATPKITITPINPVNGAARTFSINFPTQRLSGNYTATLGTGILAVSANPANPSQGTPVDTNLNAGVDALRGVTSGPTIPSSYAAAGVPVAIPAGPSAPAGPATMLTSRINVPDNFAIQGDTATASGITVQFNITYPFDPDLTVLLTSPFGKTITLFAHVGNGSVTANFSDTTLSDVTNPLAPISAAGAPFFATYNPQTPLASFLTDNNGTTGTTTGGVWTLTILNSGTSGFAGTLNRWSLTFQRPQPSTGLGEPVADQKTVGFRIFNIAPTDPLSNNSWTAVGPTGIISTNANGSNTNRLAGPVSVVAFDPSDPSGNTAFIGASSGGVWRTTDFLTTSANGPTYIPLTDFGPNYAANIGGIAIFGRNGDPGQSIVFAGTGNGQASYGAGGNAARGVGILRSFDGGSTWNLLDSTVNVDSAGNVLPINSPLRDHVFVGTTTFKLLVDPKLSPNGGVIIYAALGGTNGGLWRSDDGGGHWQDISPTVNGTLASVATDVIFDQNSVSPSTGNIDILYASFQGVGVFISSNRGQAFSLVAGTVGAVNLIQNTQFVPAPPLTVNNIQTPNGAFGRIVLAKPALTSNAALNILYQDWLYAAVENADGTFRGLYETKDRGENWTLVRLADQSSPPNNNATRKALPTNDNTQTNNYDVSNATGGGGGGGGSVHNGNYAFSLTVDPFNPNIVYLGGTQDYQTSGLIRVDLTGIYDAHSFVPFANDRNDGGTLGRDALGRIDVNAPLFPDPYFIGSNPRGFRDPNLYTNLRHSPTDPFNLNATLYIYNSNGFTNDGTGVRWTPIDEIYGLPLGGSTNIHQLLTMVDPLTGLTRLVVANDQGVFTGLYNADGTLSTSGIGTAASVNGSRNGNLQNAEFYYGAAQPSAISAELAGALFYGSGVGVTNAQSDSNLLSNGNLTWIGRGVQYGDLQDTIKTDDRVGSGIATDQTGGTTITNPIGTGPSSYEFDQPFLGGDTTNFFRVNTNGQTTGLVNNFRADFPAVSPVYNGVIPLGNFAVNPINGSQILISTAAGDLYQTVNKGVQWLRIGVGSGDFDGTYAPAVTYGAPDPNAPNGLGNLNNFIYAGTVGGHIYVTRSGGGPWTALSNGLDGSSVVAIYTNPDRGSHEAYAITLKGVYYMADSVASVTNPTPTWVNITGNLTQIQHNPFNNASLGEALTTGFDSASGAFGGFRSIVADYRYAVPDASGNGLVHPVLYVAGYGGVFRSLDNGQNWTAFPNTAFDAAPVDGGYLPTVDVTNLDLNLGAVNPATGRPTQVLGDPVVLLATTFGRGAFAIRLAPSVLPGTIGLSNTLPPPGGSDSGASSGDRVTNVASAYFNGVSEISNFGNLVTINIYEYTGGVKGQLLGTGTTDAFGRFSVQIIANNSSFFHDSTQLDDKVIGIQATDSSGATGNITTFAYTLKRTPPPRTVAPGLDPALPAPRGSDAGRSPTDRLTNITAPVFDIATTEPASTTILLYRLNPATNQYDILVGSAPAGVGTVRITDTSLAALTVNIGPTQFSYEAIQVDLAGNRSQASLPQTITVKTTLPATPSAPALDPASDSGSSNSDRITNNRNPNFIVTGLEPNGQLVLFRSTGGGPLTVVGVGAVGGNQVRDTTGVVTDGIYVYVVAQGDVYGNGSLISQGTSVTISTQTPAKPTVFLFPADDSGAPLHPGITKDTTPRFNGVGTPGLGIVILRVVNGNNAGGTPIATATVSPDGTYLAQVTAPLADGPYSIVARTVNAAGNVSFSDPLAITIKANGPGMVPTLSILPADDTGIKGDDVTASRRPRFVGVTDPGVTVRLYSILPDGTLSGVQATATSSTINGAFQFQLPFELTDGSTQLVAQAFDLAGNAGPPSPALAIRIVTVAGDYINAGSAQFGLFGPNWEGYAALNAANGLVSPVAQADTTPGRDIPVQYDFNGDGRVDTVSYRFDSAEYVGTLSNGAAFDVPFGTPGFSLPVSGNYDASGTFIYGLYNPIDGLWALTLPQPGGLFLNFGVPRIDIPTPAAFDGSGITEMAVFRPQAVYGNDADSFSVAQLASANGTLRVSNAYEVSFTDPAVPGFRGFVYQPGDIPAPADYDGIGRDQFAIYRPSTGQFFIASVPNPLDKNSWSYRVVTMSLPGGSRTGDVPVSQDYEGTGKASPAVFRPSTATFYEIQSTNGVQRTIRFGTPGLDVAAAGPLLYRLSALSGPYATNAGFGPSVRTGGGGTIVTASAAVSIPEASTVAKATAPAGPSAAPVLSSTVALATPSPLVAAKAQASAPIPLSFTRQVAPVAVAQAADRRVTVGVTTPKAAAKTHHASKPDVQATPAKKSPHARQAAAKKSQAPAKPLKVESTPNRAKSAPDPDRHHAAVAAALANLGPIRKGRHDD